MECAEIEWVALAWVLGGDNVDLDRCDTEDKGRSGGEEAEEATSCCLVAGENAVEGRAVFVKAVDDEDCNERSEAVQESKG